MRLRTPFRAAVCTGCMLAFAQSAFAQGAVEPAAEPAGERAPTTEDPDADPVVVTERRGGFVLGVIAGPTLGWATGNPSGKAERDDAALEQSSGLGLGYRLTPFLGGALTDWFTFGLGMSFANFSSGDYSSPVSTFVFHLETFPLYGQGGIYRDIGLSADFGAGASTIKDKQTDDDVADSGVMSTVGLGTFWEALRMGHFAGGPYVGFQHNWSRWYARDDVVVGLRLMFYGDQP